jgi:type III secretory pathway component EscS
VTAGGSPIQEEHVVVAAVKGHTRGCHVSMIGAATKIQDEALAQKLGDICNKLFALP